MADLICRLYERDFSVTAAEAHLKEEGISFKRAHPVDKARILNFVGETFSDGWRNECEHSFSYPFPTCYIAVKDKAVIGFACFEATGRGFFGPIGIAPEFRRKRIGDTLTRLCLNSMKEMGYAYAIIGWASTGARPFYTEGFGAVEIPESEPRNSIYRNLINVD